MSTLTIERTARRIVWGTWGCAGITMAASAANAALTYGALGDNRVLGLATGVAVDIGLCVALIGDRRLYAHGLTSTWGRVLRITTAVMSLVLNTGIAVRDGHYFLALMHAFLPVLLVVLTEYGQDVLLQFTALQRAQQETDRLTDRTGPVVPTQPTGPVRPTLAALTPIAQGGTMRATSAPGPSPSGPVPLLDQSAPHPGAQRFDTVNAHRGGSTSHPNDQVTPAVASARHQPSPASPAPASASRQTRQPSPAPTGDLVELVRPLVADGLGRQAISTKLGITPHQARQAIESVKSERPALRAVAVGGTR
jgi:hypothetical protein